MTLKPGAPGTRTAYADLTAAIMSAPAPVFHIGPEQPALLLYKYLLQSHRILNESEKDTLLLAQDTLINLMDEDVRQEYYEECSRIRRRDALRDG